MKEVLIQVRVEKALKEKAIKKARESDYSNISEWVRALIRLALKRK